MMNKANESFSAFLDGEANELDIQRMLKALDDAPETLTNWHQMSKVQAGLQNNVMVDTALELTDADLQPVATPKSVFGFRLMQGGIAAAVAVVVVTTANFVKFDPQLSPSVATAVVTTDVVTINVEPTVSLAQQQFEAQQRLDLFLREHAEQASFTTGHAVVPAQLEWEEATE